MRIIRIIKGIICLSIVVMLSYYLAWYAAATVSTVYGIFNPSPEEVAKQKAEQLAQEAKQLAEDKASATKMKVSLALYRWGKDRAMDVSLRCRQQVVDSARYGARKTSDERDWKIFPDHHILIVGQDVKMKNMFNAEQTVQYRCDAVAVKDNSNPFLVEWSIDVLKVEPL